MKGRWSIAFCVFLLFGGTLGVSVEPVPGALPPGVSNVVKVQYLDRGSRALSRTFQNGWNIHDVQAVESMPRILVPAFLCAEDRKFFAHRGVDVGAILAAGWQNARHFHVVRGGSTITEQVIRMIHPRPRNVWSRVLDAVEATMLEQHFSKHDILETYLNQVPYARKRRGVVQASYDLFGRPIELLNERELIALAVIVRAPSRLDLQGRSAERAMKQVNWRVDKVISCLRDNKWIRETEYNRIHEQSIRPGQAPSMINAEHFLRFVDSVPRPKVASRIQTTLDSQLQERLQQILDSRVRDLRSRQVDFGALVAVDHRANQVLAWVNSGQARGLFQSEVDGVLAKRQPGSTLKPFLYGLTFEHGWTPATMIYDEPLSKPVGNGLKEYRNFSGLYHGKMRVREALGNSLNIPAILAIEYVGRRNFYETLHGFGFTSLKELPSHYGDGLALGNGEVTLYELVTAYASLARGGVMRHLAVTLDDYFEDQPKSVLAPEAAALISDILSDSEARALEFGPASILDFPVQTAVKTGTSTDYRDAWAVGYSGNFTIGVWMGNFDRRPMLEVTGSVGPALVLRSAFAELERSKAPRSLTITENIEHHEVCVYTGMLPGDKCPKVTEAFISGTAPTHKCTGSHQGHGSSASSSHQVQLELPTPGLRLAFDPRLPSTKQAFPLTLAPSVRPITTDWLLDNTRVGTTGDGVLQFRWPVHRGAFEARARVKLPDGVIAETPSVRFYVR